MNTANQQDFEFEYMMLGRLKGDVEFYFGCGNRNAEYALYYKDFDKHIDEMVKLWDGFPSDIKPEWLSLETIESYRSM